MPELPIASITIGERRREDYGDIAALAESIRRYGLLHPIVVDDQSNLVAGGRRLEACRHLGWSAIPVTLLGDLSEAERREIELEENLRRKDLTPAEQSRTMVKLAETAREIAASAPDPDPWPEANQEVEESGEFRAKLARNSKGGRPAQPGSYRNVAERIGVPQPTIRRAEQHVEALDEYPFMALPDWKQDHAIAARKRLDQLPEPERELAAKLIDQDHVPPRDAVAMLGNLVAMPEPERARVFDLNESNDPRDRQLAATIAAQKPPMPDERLTNLNLAAEQLRIAAKMFPSDPFTPRINELAKSTRAVSAEIKEHPRG